MLRSPTAILAALSVALALPMGCAHSGSGGDICIPRSQAEACFVCRDDFEKEQLAKTNCLTAAQEAGTVVSGVGIVSVLTISFALGAWVGYRVKKVQDE